MASAYSTIPGGSLSLSPVVRFGICIRAQTVVLTELAQVVPLLPGVLVCGVALFALCFHVRNFVTGSIRARILLRCVVARRRAIHGEAHRSAGTLDSIHVVVPPCADLSPSFVGY